MIREIESEAEIIRSVQVIREAFGTVAKEFGLTESNCPTNPAFTTIENLKAMKEKGVRFFGLFAEGKQAGLVGIQKAGDTLYYMERLAVSPEYRHGGLGKQLLDFVFDYVKKENGGKVSIGIINENSILKKWYQDYGFVETAIKNFSHLPFTVCLMEREVL